jgi:hypothetical protein
MRLITRYKVNSSTLFIEIRSNKTHLRCVEKQVVAHAYQTPLSKYVSFFRKEASAGIEALLSDRSIYTQYSITRCYRFEAREWS